MGFHPRVVFLAMLRQSKQDGWGSWCAKCGISLAFKNEQALPIIPFKQGGRKTADNCVVFCPDCPAKLTNPGVEEIPMSAIPYYRRVPENWVQQCK
jgi:hypothetical protein